MMGMQHEMAVLIRQAGMRGLGMFGLTLAKEGQGQSRDKS
jgi:hypothetical protein